MAARPLADGRAEVGFSLREAAEHGGLLPGGLVEAAIDLDLWMVDADGVDAFTLLRVQSSILVLLRGCERTAAECEQQDELKVTRHG